MWSSAKLSREWVDRTLIRGVIPSNWKSTFSTGCFIAGIRALIWFVYLISFICLFACCIYCSVESMTGCFVVFGFVICNLNDELGLFRGRNKRRNLFLAGFVFRCWKIFDNHRVFLVCCRFQNRDTSKALTSNISKVASENFLAVGSAWYPWYSYDYIWLRRWTWSFSLCVSNFFMVLALVWLWY